MADEHPLSVIDALSGDSSALRALWHEHRGWIAAVILAHKPRSAELEDLLQEVALTVVSHLHEVKDPAAVRGWLRSVAINAARAAGRKSTRRARLARPGGGVWDRLRGRGQVVDHADEASHPHPAPGDVRDAADEGERLLQLAEQIPEAYREPLLLKCARGMSYRQIGELLGLPETTIETRIARGRRMLRELAERPREVQHAAAGAGVPATLGSAGRGSA